MKLREAQARGYEHTELQGYKAGREPVRGYLSGT